MVTQQEIDWIIASSILFPVSTASITLRIMATRVRGSSLKLRDYLVFLCYFFQIVYMIHMSIGVTLGGYGIHITELPPDRISVTLKTYFSQEFIWATGTLAFRLSILLFYHEIFQLTSFRWAVIGTSAVSLAWWVACIITICLLCQPTAFNWDRSLDGTCGNIDVVYMFTAAFNMALDIWVVFLPLPMIWRLQLSSTKKWSITASFALGFCTAGINLGRLVQNANCPAFDVSYCALDSCILVVAELAGGILVATVPTLAPIFVRHKKGKHSDGSDDGPKIRTIGSIPLRPSRKKVSTLDGSLFSQTATLAGTRIDKAEDIKEFTRPLGMRAADKGHQAEMGKTRTSGDSEDRLVQVSRGGM